LQSALAAVRRPRDLAALPPNDLASSPLAAELLRLGAFRADVSGAGPAVYGLFHHRRHAGVARRALRSAARTWLTVPVWYG
jgi:4-diphosphocytidyl-2C-methyl-D-erythritol kinase